MLIDLDCCLFNHTLKLLDHIVDHVVDQTVWYEWAQSVSAGRIGGWVDSQRTTQGAANEVVPATAPV